MVYGVEQERERLHRERHVDAVDERRVMSASTPLARSARVDSQRSRSRKTNNPESVATWMKHPIDGDASWAPLPPPPPPNHSPRPSGKVKTPTPVAPQRQNPPKISNHQSVSVGAVDQRDPIPVPNPVSSSDSSSASDLPCSKGRGRTTDRTALLPSSQHGSPNRRGRSRTSRTPTTERTKSPSAAKQTTSSHHQSRGRSATRGQSTERARSTSKTRAVERPRSTSRTRVHNVGTPTPNVGHPTGHKSATRRSRSVSQTHKQRGRSHSRPRSSSKPPATSRTRAQYHGMSSSNSVGPGLPRRSRAGRPASDDGSMRGRDISFGRTAPVTSLSVNSKGKRRQGGFMEKLFGDRVSEQAKQAYLPGRDTTSCAVSVSSRMSTQQPDRIHPRILLSATIYHNTATSLWIATINTNQKGVAKNPTTASKYLKAFSFPSEREARESAIANAPPKMLHFDSNPNCFICNGKFAVFRRPNHCRNCGVCVCNGCSTTWAAKMIPETYNLKNEAQVKICKSCHHLNCSFKRALLDGDYEETIALYGTGNVNLRTQCPQTSPKKKEELMFPIHCAVEGGNLEIVRWLMDEHFCPIKVIRTGSNKNSRQGSGYDVPILTNKGRSVLAIALQGLKVDILRYLVVDKGVSVYETKDLKYSLQALEAVLHAFPDRSNGFAPNGLTSPRWDNRTYSGSDEGSVTSSLGDEAESPAEEGSDGDDGKNKHRVANGAESCIICYENPVDCVITPCGHQMCCLECSSNLKICPVCNKKGDFIKIFRPQ